MSDSSCYYYDSDHNRCLCYDNQSLDNLLVENAKLRKENAELRVDIDLMNCQLSARAEELNDLQAENIKLRELVALQREFSETMCGSKCKRKDEYCGFMADEECHYEHEIYDRMVELGIEVRE